MYAKSISVLAVCAISCSSSGSNAPSTQVCSDFAGSYVIDYDTQSGTCGTLPVSQTKIALADGGGVLVSQPTGATSIPGSEFDGASCTANFGWSVPAAPGCSDIVTYQVTFSQLGFAGTLTLDACTDDAGAVGACSGTYNVTGVRQ